MAGANAVREPGEVGRDDGLQVVWLMLLWPQELLGGRKEQALIALFPSVVNKMLKVDCSLGLLVEMRPELRLVGQACDQRPTDDLNLSLLLGRLLLRRGPRDHLVLYHLLSYVCSRHQWFLKLDLRAPLFKHCFELRLAKWTARERFIKRLIGLLTIRSLRFGIKILGGLTAHARHARLLLVRLLFRLLIAVHVFLAVIAHVVLPELLPRILLLPQLVDALCNERWMIVLLVLRMVLVQVKQAMLVAELHVVHAENVELLPFLDVGLVLEKDVRVLCDGSGAMEGDSFVVFQSFVHFIVLSMIKCDVLWVLFIAISVVGLPQQSRAFDVGVLNQVQILLALMSFLRLVLSISQVLPLIQFPQVLLGILFFLGLLWSS